VRSQLCETLIKPLLIPDVECHAIASLILIRARCSVFRPPVIRSLGKEVSKTIGSDILTVQWSWPVSKPLVDGIGLGLYEIRSTHERTE
jgi:hypothetical protein